MSTRSIPSIFGYILSGFRPARLNPGRPDTGYIHLYLEMVGMGILSGSTLAFAAIFASRLGASILQIGLITAAPGITSLLFTFPSGEWLGGRPIGKAVFTAAVCQRFFYLVMAFLPLLLSPEVTVLSLIIILFVMNIPGTAVAVGMNALFGAAVTPDDRAHVMGIRNACFSAATMVAALLSSQLLAYLPFTGGYILVFTLGFLGAALSSLQIRLIQPALIRRDNSPPRPSAVKSVQPARIKLLGKMTQLLRLEVMQGAFRRVVVLLFFLHFAQYLPMPIFPVYIVRVLKLSDQMIGLGSLAFNLGCFLGSIQLDRITRRWGSHRATAIGVITLSFYPVLLIISGSPLVYLTNNFITGVFYSLIIGALYNYLLERSHPSDLPAHMAWYNLALNAAILLASLLSPLIGNGIGLENALVVSMVIRLLTGIIIYFRG